KIGRPFPCRASGKSRRITVLFFIVYLTGSRPKSRSFPGFFYFTYGQNLPMASATIPAMIRPRKLHPHTPSLLGAKHHAMLLGEAFYAQIIPITASDRQKPGVLISRTLGRKSGRDGGTATISCKERKGSSPAHHPRPLKRYFTTGAMGRAKGSFRSHHPL
ncbi:hypothetical protein JOD24_002675, partial [Kroppenstedtia sanguinis]